LQNTQYQIVNNTVKYFGFKDVWGISAKNIFSECSKQLPLPGGSGN
jgi:hypothetical protein